MHLYVIKLIEMIFRNQWYTTSDKDTWTLIYIVNYMFDMHDVLEGSFLSLRLVRISKTILMNILDTRHSTMN